MFSLDRLAPQRRGWWWGHGLGVRQTWVPLAAVTHKPWALERVTVPCQVLTFSFTKWGHCSPHRMVGEYVCGKCSLVVPRSLPLSQVLSRVHSRCATPPPSVSEQSGGRRPIQSHAGPASFLTNRSWGSQAPLWGFCPTPVSMAPASPALSIGTSSLLVPQPLVPLLEAVLESGCQGDLSKMMLTSQVQNLMWLPGVCMVNPSALEWPSCPCRPTAIPLNSFLHPPALPPATPPCRAPSLPSRPRRPLHSACSCLDARPCSHSSLFSHPLGLPLAGSAMTYGLSEARALWSPTSSVSTNIRQVTLRKGAQCTSPGDAGDGGRQERSTRDGQPALSSSCPQPCRNLGQCQPCLLVFGKSQKSKSYVKVPNLLRR